MKNDEIIIIGAEGHANSCINLNAASSIGNNCIINSKALIEHDFIIGNNFHISTSSVINGELSIGDNTFIGSSAVLKKGITIG